MCFRPTEVEMPPVNCPNCGEEVFYSSGVLPSKCPFCRTSLEGVGAAANVAASAPAAPNAPMTPNAPMAPNTPMAPKAP